MHFFAEYGLFLAKTITFVVAILIVMLGIIAIASRGKEKEKIQIKKLNDKLQEVKEDLSQEVLSKAEFKKQMKVWKKTQKSEDKKERKRIFVLDFNGDVRASAVNNLREEITAILMVATPKDEVLVKLESAGGMVHSYGLAASQLERIKQKQIPLIAAVDKVAASGGYLMACVADTILAAPFAIIGSIGVIAQLPNFHRFLKKHDIDFEQVTAGAYKRTLTMFGENTEKGREKMRMEIEDIHHQFKEFIQQNRPSVDVEEVATGEHWLANRALALKLVDKLITSDDYLLNASQTADLYQIIYKHKKSLGEKIMSNVTLRWQKLIGKGHIHLS
ncbi:protease SohB [soil metagenome]